MKFLRKLWSDGGFRLLTLFLIAFGIVFQIGVYIVDGLMSFPVYTLGALAAWCIVFAMAYLLRNNP